MSVSEAGDVRGRRKPGNSRVEMRVQAANADGAVQPTTDLNQAIAMCTAVSWHSTYPWSTTQSMRRFSGSIVVLYDGEGNWMYRCSLFRSSDKTGFLATLVLIISVSAQVYARRCREYISMLLDHH